MLGARTAFVGLVLALTGCNGLSVRKADSGSTTDTIRTVLRLESPSKGTAEFLTRLGAPPAGYGFDPAAAADRLGDPPTPEGRLAKAELSILAGREAEVWAPSKAMGRYLDAAYFASRALLDEEPLPVDRRGDAADIYNQAVERFLRHSAGRKFLPDRAWEERLAKQELAVTVRRDAAVWAPEPFDELKFSDDYLAIGVLAHRRDGLGVPLVAVRERGWRDPDRQTPPEKFYPPAQAYPMTALLRFVPDRRAGRPPALLELHDPLRFDGVAIAERQVPLAADFSTPLVYQVTQSDLERITYIGLLDPQAEEHKTGLYLTHPYERGKIPVVLIHGLWSSPKTWTRAINDLRADPAIRSRYQFWTFQYPTGNPFIESAADLRQSLKQLRAYYDPDGSDPAFDQMVVVGHSMGGLIAKTLITRSDDAVWNVISNRPFSDLKADAEQKQYLERAFFFEPMPCVKRAIFIAVPHRGSMLGNNWVGQIGDRLIHRPNVLVQAHDALVKENGNDFFTDNFLSGVPSSVRLLQLHSPLLQAVDELPYTPNVPKHSIIASVAPVPLEVSTDGIVPYSSSHLVPVKSEKVVSGSHGCLDQADVIEEIRRILLLHVEKQSGD